jgi:hypothetical protein
VSVSCPLIRLHWFAIAHAQRYRETGGRANVRLCAVKAQTICRRLDFIQNQAA